MYHASCTASYSQRLWNVRSFQYFTCFVRRLVDAEGWPWCNSLVSNYGWAHLNYKFNINIVVSVGPPFREARDCSDLAYYYCKTDRPLDILLRNGLLIVQRFFCPTSKDISHMDYNCTSGLRSDGINSAVVSFSIINKSIICHPPGKYYSVEQKKSS